MSVSLYDRCAAHAAAYAKGCKTLLGIPLLHLIEQSYEDTGTGASYGMSEGDRAAVDIELVHIKAEIMANCYRLCRKRLISFDQVEIADLVAASLHGLAGSRYRADTHDAGLYACQLAGDPCSLGLNAELFGLLFAHNDDRCRCIVNTGGVSCCDNTVLLESGTELGDGLLGRSGTRAFISVYNDSLLLGLNLYREDLILKLAFLDCLGSLLLGPCRKLVELLSCKSPLLRM